MKSPTKKRTVDQWLESALAATPLERLVALLEAWRQAPWIELANLIDAIPSPAKALRGKFAINRHLRWLELARLADPLLVPLLLSKPTTLALDLRAGASWGYLFDRRLELVAFWPPDPRVAAALVAYIESKGENYHARGQRVALQALKRIRDPRSIPNLKVIVQRTQTDGPQAQRVAVLAKLVAIFPNGAPKPNATQKRILTKLRRQPSLSGKTAGTRRAASIR